MGPRENIKLNVTKFKRRNRFKRWEGERGAKGYADLKGCQGVQHFRFDTNLECFKYSVLVSGHKLL